MGTKVMTSLFLMVFFLAPAYAKDRSKTQPSPSPEKTTLDQVVAKLVLPLNLTDKQVPRIKAILADYMEREKQLKLQERKALLRVLNADQIYAWDDLHKQESNKKHSL